MFLDVVSALILYAILGLLLASGLILLVHGSVGLVRNAAQPEANDKPKPEKNAAPATPAGRAA